MAMFLFSPPFSVFVFVDDDSSPPPLFFFPSELVPHFHEEQSSTHRHKGHWTGVSCIEERWETGRIHTHAKHIMLPPLCYVEEGVVRCVRTRLPLRLLSVI